MPFDTKIEQFSREKEKVHLVLRLFLRSLRENFIIYFEYRQQPNVCQCVLAWLIRDVNGWHLIPTSSPKSVPGTIVSSVPIFTGVSGCYGDFSKSLYVWK